MKPTHLCNAPAALAGSTMAQPELRAFNVVAFYDDLSDGLHAKAVFERMRQTLSPVVHVNTYAWSLQQLYREDVRNHAAHVVSLAGMIVIALHARQFPCGELEQWLDDCLGGRSNTGPLFVALDGGTASRPDGSGGDTVLDEFARRRGSRIIHNEKFEEKITLSSALQWARCQPATPAPCRQNYTVRGPSALRHFGIND